MSFLSEELENGAKAAGVSYEVLERAETDQLRKRIVERFSNGKDEWPIWEKLDATGVQDEEAWRWIADFSEGPVLLIFNKQDERRAFRFASGSELVRALGESARFEFYVSDPAATYILCFNHHRYLIAAGSAKAWLESRLKKPASPKPL